MLTRRIKELLVNILKRRPGARKHLQYLLRQAYPGFPIISQSEYPLDSKPRYGYGKPPHESLHRLINRNRDAYRDRLESFLTHRDALVRIPKIEIEGDPTQPFWTNQYLPGLDLVGLYGLIASEKPKRYVEIGSGNSTKLVRRALTDLGLPTTITSYDPNPRAEVDSLCDQVIRHGIETVDPAAFDELESGDVLFVDNSHRVLMNSDVTVVFLEIMPRLKPGVLVHIHDIFLPYDYPSDWKQRYYSEQYLLASLLLFGSGSVEILLPNMFIHRDPELSRLLDPLWSDPRLAEGPNRIYPYIDWLRGGSSFWLRMRALPKD